MPKITDIRLRAGWAADWVAANPVLGVGEPGFERETYKIKIGDGVNTWAGLPYMVSDAGTLPTPPVGDAQAWGGWTTAMQRMGVAPVKWLAIGDSITEGTGSTAYTDTWVYKTAQKVRAAFPTINGLSVSANAVTGQIGWTPITQTSSTMVSQWTPAGTYGSGSSFGFRQTKSTSIVSSATLTATVTGTHIDVWWTQGTTTVPFTVWVNGVQKASLGTSSASVISGFNARVQLGSSATVPGTYTVQIKANSSANPSYINGVTILNNNDASGLQTYNAGVHGYKTTEWNASTANATWINDYSALDPHLVTVMLGANDYSSLIGKTSFMSNLTNMVNSLRTNNDNWPTILLMSCYKENFTFTPSWEIYEYSMEKVAQELGCAYFDLRTVMPDPGTVQAIDGGYYADGIHLNPVGNEKVAQELANILIARAGTAL
jgi:lysophospholipase L1-like esterase